MTNDRDEAAEISCPVCAVPVSVHNAAMIDHLATHDTADITDATFRLADEMDTAVRRRTETRDDK